MDGIQLDRSGRIEARRTLGTRMHWAKRFTLCSHLRIVRRLIGFAWPRHDGSSAEVSRGTTKVLLNRLSAFNFAPIGVAGGSSALLIVGQSRSWSDRHLFSAFNASQQLSIRF